MATSNFAAKTREHELQTGRTVLVRDHLSFMALTSRLEREEDGLAEIFAGWTSGETIAGTNAKAALRLHDVLIQELVVQPRVHVPDVDADGDGEYGVDWCWIGDLTDQELAELVDLASQGVGDVARFPGDPAINDDRADSEVVEDTAKPAARPRKRKR